MATVTHYIYSHYDPEEDRERLERETGQVVDAQNAAKTLDPDEAWEREAALIPRRALPPPKFVPATISYDPWCSNDHTTDRRSSSKGKKPLGASLSSWYRTLTSAASPTPTPGPPPKEHDSTGSLGASGSSASPIRVSRTSNSETPSHVTTPASSSPGSAIHSKPSLRTPQTPAEPDKADISAGSNGRTNAERKPRINWFASKPFEFQSDHYPPGHASSSSSPPAGGLSDKATQRPVGSGLADMLSRNPPPLPGEGKFKPPVWIQLGPSNKGFGLLQRAGWNTGEPLGPGVVRRKRVEDDENAIRAQLGLDLDDEEVDVGVGAGRKDSKKKSKRRRISISELSIHKREIHIKTEAGVGAEDDDVVTEVRQVDVIDLTDMLSSSSSSEGEDEDEDARPSLKDGAKNVDMDTGIEMDIPAKNAIRAYAHAPQLNHTLTEFDKDEPSSRLRDRVIDARRQPRKETVPKRDVHRGAGFRPGDDDHGGDLLGLDEQVGMGSGRGCGGVIKSGPGSGTSSVNGGARGGGGVKLNGSSSLSMQRRMAGPEDSNDDECVVTPGPSRVTAIPDDDDLPPSDPSPLCDKDNSGLPRGDAESSDDDCVDEEGEGANTLRLKSHSDISPAAGYSQTKSRTPIPSTFARKGGPKPGLGFHGTADRGGAQWQISSSLSDDDADPTQPETFSGISDHDGKALLTPLPTILKSDRLGIGLKAKLLPASSANYGYKVPAKRVTHNAAALKAHEERAEEARRRKGVFGRGRRGLERVYKKDLEDRKALLAYMKE